MFSIRSTCALSACAPLLSALALGQSLFTVEFEPGDAFGASGETIEVLGEPASNSRGGWSVSAAIDSSGTTTRVLWGTLDGQAPGFLLREDSLLPGPDGLGPSLLFRNRLSDTGIAYDIRFPNGASPCDTFAIRHGDVDIACRFTPSTILPWDWDVFEDYALTPDDRLVSVFSPFDLSVVGVLPIGIFDGDDLDRVLYIGDTVPGIPAPTNRLGAVRLSERGAYAAALNFGDGTPRTVIADGLPVVTRGGLFVQEGAPVEADLGPGSPAWFRLRITAASTLGDWAVAGLDNGPNPTNALLMKNGEVILREGSTYDGITLQGEALELRANPDGSFLSAWNGADASGDIRRCLFLDDRLMVSAGDPVDADGDGVPDPEYRIRATGLDPITIDEDRVVRVVARADGLDAPFGNVLFSTQVPMGDAYCASTPNSDGVRSSILALGTQRIEANDLRLGTRGVPTGSLGYYLVSRTPGSAPGAGGSAGTLCLGGTIGRFAASAATADGTGSIELRPDLDDLPASAGTFAVTAGESLYFQLWHRDTDGAGAATSNFSDGLALRFR